MHVCAAVVAYEKSKVGDAQVKYRHSTHTMNQYYLGTPETADGDAEHSTRTFESACESESRTLIDFTNSPSDYLITCLPLVYLPIKSRSHRLFGVFPANCCMFNKSGLYFGSPTCG
ncbi:hypothetical protein BDR07DRAFT_283861 [Suillus spraguei]|nr:hypothetical protein BDR07DRAFT_283861 [Suillus spraguei]